MQTSREDKAGICYIVGAGDFGDGRPEPAPGDILIAGDGGYEACRERGISPDLIIGDFDSLGFTPEGDSVIVLPVIKDDTDMRAAVKIGWEKGFRDFVLYGGTGGRLSHTMANIQLMSEITGKGGSALLIGFGSKIRVIRGGTRKDTYHFDAECRGSISVFAIGGKASGVTEEGLFYTLEDGELEPDYALGVSNHFTGQPGRVTVKEGSLLIVEEDE